MLSRSKVFFEDSARGSYVNELNLEWHSGQDVRFHCDYLELKFLSGTTSWFVFHATECYHALFNTKGLPSPS